VEGLEDRVTEFLVLDVAATDNDEIGSEIVILMELDNHFPVDGVHVVDFS
jgi:hypothetical protein